MIPLSMSHLLEAVQEKRVRFLSRSSICLYIADISLCGEYYKHENIPNTYYKYIYIYVSETATDFLRGLRTLTCMLKITKNMGQRLCSVS